MATIFKLVEDCETHQDTCNVLVSNGLIYRNYPDLGLYLIKYNKIKADLDNEEVSKCRGLVCEIGTNKIVAIPPYKSVNNEQHKLTNETIEQYKFQEYLDGTMINLFYYEGEKFTGWLISTRSTIGANCRWTSDKMFSELFSEVKEFDYSTFNTEYTYTFVLQHPDNRIVTQFTEPRLVLVEVTRNTDLTTSDNLVIETRDYLKEHGVDIGIPEEYLFHNTNELETFIEKSSYEVQGVICKLRDNNKIRMKFRNSKYNFVKTLKGNSNDYLVTYLDLKKGNYLNEYLTFFPEQKEKFIKFNGILFEIINKTFNYYMDRHIKKTKNTNDLPFIYRPLVYELHGNFLKNHIKTTPEVVKNYINNLPTRRQVFLITNKDKEYSVLEANKMKWESGFRLVLTCKSCEDSIYSSFEGELVECKCKLIAVEQTKFNTRSIGEESTFTSSFSKVI